MFLKLSVWDDELLSTPNTITFLAVSLAELHSFYPSDAIP